MDFNSLREAISPVDSLAGHVDYLMGLAKPSVQITLSDEAAIASGSRFGGHPFLPTDFQWPEREVGEYRFLGQINFVDINDRPAPLPGTGLLTLFSAEDDEGECFWGDDGYIKGFYWANHDGHATFDSPTVNVPVTRKTLLRGTVDIPRHSYLREDWPLDDELYKHLE